MSDILGPTNNAIYAQMRKLYSDREIANMNNFDFFMAIDIAISKLTETQE
jgi:hypothetical protein